MDPRPSHLIPAYTPAAAQPERLSYRLAEIEGMTGVPRKTLYDHCHRGRLDCRKDGRSVLVMAASVKRWIDSLPAVSGERGIA